MNKLSFDQMANWLLRFALVLGKYSLHQFHQPTVIDFLCLFDAGFLVYMCNALQLEGLSTKKPRQGTKYTSQVPVSVQLPIDDANALWNEY